MLLDNLNPIMHFGQLRPKNVFRKAAYSIFGKRIRWDDELTLETAKTKIAALEKQITDSGTWQEGLPDEIKNHSALKNLKTPQEVATSWINAQKLIGRDKIPLPPENATDEDWNEVFSRLGRPDKAEGYDLKEGDIKVPDGMPVDSNMIMAFKEQAHKVGLNPKQAAGLFNWYMEMSSGQFMDILKVNEKGAADADKKLTREWGSAKEQKTALAKKVFHQFADDDTFKLFDTAGFGNHPGFLKLFAAIGDVLSEDQLFGKPKELTMTPEEAQAEITKLESDLKGPLYHDDHPEHNAMVEKRRILYEMATVKKE